MAFKVVLLLITTVLIFETVKVNSSTYDKKTIDGMILKTLWEKVFAKYDPKSKELAIKTLRKAGDYNKLVDHLIKVKKEKVQHILNLFSEIVLAYVS